jgi:hypothetical protein
MTRITGITLMLLLSATAFAQRRGGSYGQGNILSPGGVTSSGGNYGYGNILFPGGVTVNPNGISRPIPAPAPHLGSPISNYPPPVGMGSPGGRFPARQRTVVVPYAVPMWIGGAGYGYDPYVQPQPPSNVTVIIPQQPTPQVIINPNYIAETAKPLMRDYSSTDLPEPGIESGGLRVYDAPTPGRGEEPTRPKSAVRTVTPVDDKPTIYLIALRDSTVRAAIGYWAEKGTLNYVTPQGTINHVSLDMLDRETTDNLNKQQGLEFDLTIR